MLLKDPRFLIISIGNPLPKYSSLHSAGHFALNRLPEILRQPNFTHSKFCRGEQCPVSIGPKYTLLQSPTYMNVSGPFVENAWKEMTKRHDPSQLSLVIVHDEMEIAMGKVKLKPWENSHKGHNGIRSIKSRGGLKQDNYPESPFVRIAVGIGRPAEKDSETVSKYVLDPIKPEARKIFEEETPYKILECLRDIEKQWVDALREAK